VRTTYVYDALNRLDEVTHRKADLAVISRHIYTYDTADRRASESTEGGLPAPAFTALLATSEFDDVNRLLSSTDPSRAYSY